MNLGVIWGIGMNRKDLISEIEKETKGKVKGISWIYGISSEPVGDSEGLCFYDVTLQVEFTDNNYITITANNYCTDSKRVIETTIGYSEVTNIESPFYVLSEDIKCKLIDYLENYCDEVVKPSLDHVYFESM